MTTVFVAFGHYAGLQHAVTMASQSNGTPPCVICDPPITERMQIVYREYKASNPRENFNLNIFSLARWFTLLSIARDFSKSRWPIFMADWDMLIFSNLNHALTPFSDFDIGRTYDFPDMENGSAAYLINNIDVLEMFCESVTQLARNKNLAGMQDMLAWHLISKDKNMRVANLSSISTDHSTFDHNMHCGHKIFRMNGSAKQIVWKDKKPHFVLLDGKLVAANVIHCFGTYKARTGELLEAAQ